MSSLQILTAASDASGTSSNFRVNNGAAINSDKIFLQIYGTLAATTTFTLKAKAPNGTFYTTGDVISGIGLFELPYSSEVVLQLAYTNSGGSPSLNACVINGVAE